MQMNTLKVSTDLTHFFSCLHLHVEFSRVYEFCSSRQKQYIQHNLISFSCICGVCLHAYEHYYF